MSEQRNDYIQKGYFVYDDISERYVHVSIYENVAMEFFEKFKDMSFFELSNPESGIIMKVDENLYYCLSSDAEFDGLEASEGEEEFLESVRLSSSGVTALPYYDSRCEIFVKIQSKLTKEELELLIGEFKK